MENEAWRSTDSPTNLILTGLTVAPDGQQMYCCGRQGMLLRGDKTHWTVVEHGLAEDFWSVECFRGRVFVASLRSIFELKGERLERVDDGSPAGSYYRLSANDDVLLSVGSAALLLFDGDRWAAID